QAQDGQCSHRLAAARFADQREHLARCDPQRDAVHHRGASALGGKRRDEGAHLQDGGGGHTFSRTVRGSRMSRIASPTKFTERISPKSATEAAARFQKMIGSRASSSRAWSIIWPQLPSSPMPRNASTASVRTMPENSSTNVIT